MPLEPRTRLGPYEIVASAGAGGMGEVYRGRDTRLGRDVAIKVLPARLAADAAFRQRLEREAQAISSLSHPHICTLYDVGRDDGIDFLVMEYLEGETLAQRLERGPLPLDQVLRYGGEIADALHAAHRRGLVHRDLKPGNVMLTKTGARLLDFGLAKPSAERRPSAESATVAAPVTTDGSIVGTVQYMAPEQIEGRDADARSDIFALGAVLHEMATGRRAFEGQTTASLIAQILEREPPPVSELQPLSPQGLDDVVKGCLAKDPDERWQTAHDVRLQLVALRRQRPPAAADAGVRRGWRPLVPWALALVLLIVAAAAWMRPGPAVPPSPRALRASLLPPARHSFTPHDFAIAPDGQRLAFVAAGADGISRLWITALDSPNPALVSGSDDADAPFWSSDSRAVAFFAKQRLLRVQADGTGLRTIGDVPFHLGGGAWSGDSILIAASVVGQLFRVPADGGTPQPVLPTAALVPGEAHRFPQFLPDGRRFLFVASWTTGQRSGLYLGDVDGGAPRLVSPEIRAEARLVGGRLLFVRGGTLYAQAFDTARGELTGAPRTVLNNEIKFDWRFGEVPFSASENGLLVYQSHLAYKGGLIWYDSMGRELGTVGYPGYSAPARSPDGTRLAVAYDRSGSGQQNIWIHDLERNIATQLTTEGIDTAHEWSPDGRFLVYSSIRDQEGLYRRPADRSGSEERLLESRSHILLNDYAALSDHAAGRLLYMDFAGGFPSLNQLDLATKESSPLRAGAEAAYSPDGAWVAYAGVVPPGVLAAPVAGGGVVQLAESGGQPRWRGDGKEIFYIATDKKMMAVPVDVREGVLTAGTPRPLFQTRLFRSRPVLFQWDVTPDGKRFLVNSLPPEDAAAPLSLLLNWPALLDGQ